MMNSVSASVERPELHFDTVSDAVREAERLAAADAHGRLTRLGNWSLGQALGHLAAWASSQPVAKVIPATNEPGGRLPCRRDSAVFPSIPLHRVSLHPSRQPRSRSRSTFATDCYPFDGYPIRPPWFVPIIGRLLKPMVLRRPLRPGLRLRGVAGGTYATDDMPTREGLERMRSAFRRLEWMAPEAPNPVFGKMSHEEWLRLNLNHAALHLSFFRAGG